MMEENNRIISANDIIDNYDPGLLEYPFARRGMTMAEFDKERIYLCQNFTATDLKNGTYVPLWRQKETAMQKDIDV